MITKKLLSLNHYTDFKLENLKMIDNEIRMNVKLISCLMSFIHSVPYVILYTDMHVIMKI